MQLIIWWKEQPLYFLPEKFLLYIYHCLSKCNTFNTFFLYCHHIITKIVIWMLAGGRIMKTRKKDIASQLRHEYSSGVTSHRVTLQILYSFHLVKRNFEYDKFRTTPRFVWCMIILVDKFYNICDINNTSTGKLMPV